MAFLMGFASLESFTGHNILETVEHNQSSSSFIPSSFQRAPAWFCAIGRKPSLLVALNRVMRVRIAKWPRMQNGNASKSRHSTAKVPKLPFGNASF